jgi:hypothetical protein
MRAPHPFTPRSRNRRGFALLITITLLAFLVLLLVSLASLTRVETQVAANNQTIGKARANALMALNIALGQLQKYAGPDQRVTATAAMGSAADATNGNSTPQSGASTTLSGLVTTSNGTRLWTGVWGNPDTPDRIYTKTPTPVLLNWLVSGNEGSVQASPAQGSPGITMDIDGHITTPSAAANAVTYRPNATVPSLSGATVSSALGNWALLVGPGTASSTSTDYIVAPLVAVNSTGVPGFAPATSVKIGNYAWWVGDEGVKANYSLVDRHVNDGTSVITGTTLPAPATTLNSLTPTDRYRLAISQRNGIEAMTNLTDYPINATSTATLLDRSQLALNQPTIGANIDLLKQRFADFTASSFGVLANTQAGGLRSDLSRHLANASLTGKILPTLGTTGNSAEDTQRTSINNLTNPTWDLLNSFHSQVTSAIGSGATPVVDITVGNATTHAVTPVVSQLRTLVRFRMDSSLQCYLGVSPIIVLANPYNVTLRSTAGVDFRYHAESANLTGESNVLGLKLKNDTTSADITTPANVIYIVRTHTNTNRALLSNLVLRTGAFTIPPGGSTVFSLGAGVVAPSTNTVIVANLVQGTANLDPSLAIDVPMGSVPATALTDPAKWRLHRVDPGYAGAFSFSMYPQSGSWANDPMSVRPLQRIENVGLGGVGGYPNMPFDHPTTAGDFTQYYVSRRQTLGTPLEPVVGRQRIYADYNIRAQLMRRPVANDNVSSAASSAAANGNPSYLALGPVITGNNSPTFWTQELSSGTSEAYWGQSYTNAAGQSSMVLFDLLGTRNSASPLVSVGDLQHANLTALLPADLRGYYNASYDLDMTVCDQSGNLVGNSWTNPYVSRQLSAYTIPSIPTGGLVNKSETYFDLGYLLNTALWDARFFSTVPQTGSTLPTVLPNGRMRPSTAVLADLQGADTTSTKAAAGLMLQGAFNVNSVSIEAWKAVLSGLRFATNDTRYVRTLNQPGSSTNSANGGNNQDAYNGYRTLTNAQVTDLATQIVSQVRQRGPFMSLAHFVNRKLTSRTATDSALGLKGALQSAIDATSTAPINIAANFNPQTTQAASDNIIYADPPAVLGAQAAGIPGWLTQADLMQALGPTLAARSDTFVIRTYGETLDPISATPVVLGRAWCEAVVQRVVEPVNRKSTVTASSDYHEPTTATPTAPDFGRKFKVVSFRWLSPDDI